MQVLLASREVLCLPSAALAALLQHELAHNGALIEAELAPFAAISEQSEAHRARHQGQLRPGLAQPACKQELADLRAREDERWAQELGSGADLLQRVADVAPAAAQVSEQRLLGLSKQAAQLFSTFPGLEDLVPASAGDTSLDAVPPLNLLQLERWSLAQEDVDTVVSGDAQAGRPLAQASATLHRVPLAASDLGWSRAHDLALERALHGSGRDAISAEPSLETAPSGAAKGGKAGAKAAAAATSKAADGAAADGHKHVPIAGVDAPSFRSVVRAHRAAATMLQTSSAAQVQRALQVPMAALEKALAWQDTWQAMLRHLEPAKVPERGDGA